MSRADLIVPGLLHIPAEDPALLELQRHTPHLHQLLRFSRAQSNTHFDLDALLLHRLGLEQAGLPYAHAVNPDPDVAQILFKPVYLKSDINNAIVYPVDIDSAFIRKIINDLSDYFKVDCDIKSCVDGLWLMQLRGVQPVANLPHVLTATGNKVSHYLDQVKAHLDWFRLLNEMQMFLFQHAVNQQRLVDGMPMANSLWCWGSDAYGGENDSRLHWFSDSELMRSLGGLYAGSAHSLRAIDQHLGTHNNIVVIQALLEALKGYSNKEPVEILLEVDALIGQLMESRVDEIALFTGGPLNFRYTPRMAWQFWRHPVQLLDLS